MIVTLTSKYQGITPLNLIQSGLQFLDLPVVHHNVGTYRLVIIAKDRLLRLPCNLGSLQVFLLCEEENVAFSHSCRIPDKLDEDEF